MHAYVYSHCAGPFAPVVAVGGIAATTAAAATSVTATGIAIANHGQAFNEDQKIINDEYVNVSSRCERTLEDARKVTQGAFMQVKELHQIAKEFKQLATVNLDD